MVIEGKQTFESLGQRIRDDVEREHAGITDPEGDVEPMVYLYKQGTQTLHVHSLGMVLSTPDYQAQFVMRTKIAIKVGGIRLVGLQTTAYRSVINRSELTPEQVELLEQNIRPDDLPTPDEDPDREEAVLVHVMDAEIVKSWKAVLHREPDAPPALGPWGEEPTIGGALIEPILQALR